MASMAKRPANRSRMNSFVHLPVAVALLVAAGCERSVDYRPRELKWERHLQGVRDVAIARICEEGMSVDQAKAAYLEDKTSYLHDAPELRQRVRFNPIKSEWCDRTKVSIVVGFINAESGRASLVESDGAMRTVPKDKAPDWMK
jgi:hypothetical protein